MAGYICTKYVTDSWLFYKYIYMKKPTNYVFLFK